MTGNNEALVVSSDLDHAPTLFTPTPKAGRRVLEFFTAQSTTTTWRKAYVNATRRFGGWCAARGIRQLADIEPGHVAAFLKELEGQLSPPTVKQHLAALRMLFDCLVTGARPRGKSGARRARPEIRG